METVKTSAVLESQIMDDARAKARRIAAAAEKECAGIRAEWERKDAAETRRLEAERAARIAALQADLEATLPLDFMRARLDFYARAVNGALKEVFDSLSAAETAGIIGRLTSRARFAFEGASVTVWDAGLGSDAARAIVQKGLPGAKIKDVKTLPPEEAADAGKGVIVESADGSRRYRATLKELSGILLEEHREELVTALFGKDVQV